MIELTDKQLRKLQLIELELLKEVDRICRKCGIKYNIIAGTMLGAVRHKGFIPWDDDADVAFLRPEYEKFRTACETELDTSRFYFQDHRKTKGYRWGYGKLRMKDTLFLREFQEHMPYEQGVFIDIFPLDNVPNNYALRCIHNFHCYCIRKVMWSPVGMIASNSRLKRKWFEFIYKAIGDKVFLHYDKFVSNTNKRDSQFVRILTFQTPNNTYAYYKKWYEHSKLIEFECHEFYGIYEYDQYLSFKFGDYMTLPEKQFRKIHPVTKIKL